MTKIKIGQIGTGHAHASKLSVYRASPDYEVVGIVEPDAARRARAERLAEYKDLPWMTQEQLLNLADVQAILVETEVKDLLDVAEASIAAGKHIHLDKPAGASLPQFQRIMDAAMPKHLLVQMGYMYRYNPGVTLLREFLRNGWLGEVFELHTVMSKQMSASARRPLLPYSGGTMFELGCHLIDLVVGLLGAPDAVRPFARHSSSVDDGFRDNMLAVLEYPRSLATIKTTVLEVDGGARRHLVVCGSGGTFQIQPLDSPRVYLTLDAPRGKYVKGAQDIDVGPYQRYVADAADMARIIRGEKDTDFSPTHDLHVQKTLLQACELPLT